VIVPDRNAYRSRNKEHWSYEVFLVLTTSGKEKAGSDRYDGSRIFSDERCSLKLTEYLEA
jgi:hypothetical protein